MNLKEFENFLGRVTAFFKIEVGNEVMADQKYIASLRDEAAALAAELVLPQTSVGLSALTAYLLGNQSIHAEYALQVAQLLTLCLYNSRGLHLRHEDMQDIVTAALLSDLGFRSSWITLFDNHEKTTPRVLKSCRFSWWSNAVENMILNHHSPATDPSPFHLLSLNARYLELTRGTGVDEFISEVVQPSNAVQLLREDTRFPLVDRNVFYAHMGPYPVGSWVRLSSEQNAYILRVRSNDFAHPQVAVQTQSQVGFSFLDLKEVPKIFILGGIHAGSLRGTVLEHPEEWVPGWDKAHALTVFQWSKNSVESDFEAHIPSVNAVAPVAAAPVISAPPTPEPIIEKEPSRPHPSSVMPQMERMHREGEKSLSALSTLALDVLAAYENMSSEGLAAGDRKALQHARQNAQKRCEHVRDMTAAFQKRWEGVDAADETMRESFFESWSIFAVEQMKKIQELQRHLLVLRSDAALLPALFQEKADGQIFLLGVAWAAKGRSQEAQSAFQKAAASAHVSVDARMYALLEDAERKLKQIRSLQ